MANAGVGAGRSRRWSEYSGTGPIWKGKFVVTKLLGRYLSGATWFRDVRSCRCEPAYLPQYSPDFNSIERVFHPLKAAYCRLNHYNQDVVVAAGLRSLLTFSCSWSQNAPP
jgi:transposase